MPTRHIYLSGFMAVGKTRVGRELAKRLRWPFYDLDAEIEKQSRLSVAEIFKRFGEAEFRRRETLALQRLARVKKPAVVSLGGGTILKAQNRAILKRGHWFFLHRPLAVLAPRLKKANKRPLLATHDWRTLYQKRESYYKRAPHILRCGRASFVTVCAKLRKILKL